MQDITLLGQVVNYSLTKDDAARIGRKAGDVVSLKIGRVWPSDDGCVGGTLDGRDDVVVVCCPRAASGRKQGTWFTGAA